MPTNLMMIRQTGRHRAAYRFVRDNPQGLAIVLSQDGGVSFVANREGEAVFWEQSLSP